MKPVLLLPLVLLISACAVKKHSVTPVAQAKPRVAILNVQKAIVSTVDGLAAAEELHRKFDPGQTKLAGDQQEIQDLRSQPETEPLKARIAALERTHRHNIEDARHSFDVERERVFKELAAKLMVVVDEYAKQNHFEVVLDISDPKAAVVWRADGSDITEAVIERYDQRSLSTQTSGKFR
jgi:Skp family chaperone for outer membrane proteins